MKIAVRDTGAGIAPRHIDKVFDPYLTTKEEGSGLGFATSYSTVQKHHGHIAVASQPAAGTAFTVYFPAAAKASPAPVGSDAVRSGAGRLLLMTTTNRYARSGRRCSGLGYTVMAVADGAVAVDEYRAAQAQGRPFDAVILDLTVPGGMGGADCMHAP